MLTINYNSIITPPFLKYVSNITKFLLKELGAMIKVMSKLELH